MIRSRLKVFATMLTVSFAAVAASAGPATAEKIQVKDPYVRLMPPKAAATGAFMTLANSSDKPRFLIRAESSAAKSVELHTHLNEGGVMKMVQVEKLEIPAKGSLELKPGSHHIMLIDLTAPLKDRAKVKFTLTFDDQSQMAVEATVKPMSMGQANKGESSDGSHEGHEGHKHH